MQYARKLQSTEQTATHPQPHNWKNQQNQNLPEQNPETQELNLKRKRGQGRKIQIVTDKLLKAQGGKVWNLKTPGVSLIGRLTYFYEFHL